VKAGRKNKVVGCLFGWGRRFSFPCAVILVVAVLVVTLSEKHLPAGINWGLMATGMMGGLLALWYWGFEQGGAAAREIAVIAVLGTVAAVGRIPFAALPNIQPTTFIVIVSGFVFGPRAGFVVGSTAAVVANFFLGHGPWTPWQMFTWGLSGATAGLLGAVFPRIGPWGLAVFSFLWGYLYGWIMNLWFWTAFIHPLNLQSFIATYAASFWFDTCHAVGNLFFYLLLGPGVIRVLRRYHRRLTVEYLVPPAGGN